MGRLDDQSVYYLRPQKMSITEAPLTLPYTKHLIGIWVSLWAPR